MRKETPARPFWQWKSLKEKTVREWESLCDGCGRCCLTKLQDAESGSIHYTDAACRLLDLKLCRCRHYAQRTELIPDCVSLSPQNLPRIEWLPISCAYRRIAEGRGLAWWHPLVSGSGITVHQAGISVRGKAISEDALTTDLLEDHIIDWVEHD